MAKPASLSHPHKADSGKKPSAKVRAVAGNILSNHHQQLDRLIFERVRLGIMSALAVNRQLNFSELKHLLDASDGNLSAHARKLEDANYISCRKTFDARRPTTEYRLTAKGRKALNRYLDHMEAVIRATRGN